MNLSIIIHGALNHRGSDTLANIKKTRAVFPGAEYILCTSDSVPSEIGVHFDRVIQYTDPGPYVSELTVKREASLLRQCRAFSLGLKAATGQYAIKLRTDFALVGDNFVSCWRSSNREYLEMFHFEQPVVVLDLGCNDPTKIQGLFHCSDFFFFGLKSDLLRYWDVEQELCAITNRYFSSLEKLIHPISGRSWGRLSCEQYLFINFYSKCLKSEAIEYTRRCQFGRQAMRDYEIFLLNNFVIVGAEDGIFIPTHLKLIYKKNEHYVPGNVAHLRKNYDRLFFWRFLIAYSVRLRNAVVQVPLAYHSLLVVLWKKYVYPGVES